MQAFATFEVMTPGLENFREGLGPANTVESETQSTIHYPHNLFGGHRLVWLSWKMRIQSGSRERFR